MLWHLCQVAGNIFMLSGTVCSSHLTVTSGRRIGEMIGTVNNSLMDAEACNLKVR